MSRIAFFYLTSFGVSLLGASITAIALPLLVLFTTGSPLDAGIVALAASLPAAVAGLLMGAVVDLVNRRTAAVVADVISAVSLASLPIIELTVGLDLGWFVVVAIVSSFGDVPGITAREAMLPAIARAAAMEPTRLIGLRESLGGVAFLVGPAVAGILVASLETVTVLWVTAAVAATAALLTLLVPRAATAPREAAGATGASGPGAAVRSALGGLTILWRSPVLRGLVLLGLALAVVLAATQGMVIPVHFATEGSPELVGFVLSALAVGLLVGGGGFAALGDRVPRLVWCVLGAVMLGAGFGVIAILGPVWSIFVGAAVAGLGGGLMNAVVGLAFVEHVDDAHRGRVLGAQNALVTLVPAAGIAGSAAAIEAFGLGPTMALLVGFWVVIAAAVLLDRRMRRLGDQRVASVGA